MARLNVVNTAGEQTGEIELSDSVFGITEINQDLFYEVVKAQLASRRAGTHAAKGRSAVAGSKKKIYKQKGTGNARHGDRKVNLMKGGGHGHSKKRTREDFRLTMPKKMRRKANRNALLAKLMDAEVRIIDDIAFSEPRTKAFKDFLAAIKVDRTALVALPHCDEKSHNARLAGRNVEGATLVPAEQMNCFDLLNHRFLVIGRKDLEAWLSGPSSQTTKVAKVAPLGRKTEEATK